MVSVGDLAKYYRRRKCHDATMVVHPVLYTWRTKDTSEQVCISEADADFLTLSKSVSEYDVSDIQFEYPLFLYGYPEIYKPLLMHTHVRSYIHRLFKPDADIWIRYEGNSEL